MSTFWENFLPAAVTPGHATAAIPASAEIGTGGNGCRQEDESEEHHFDLHALDESPVLVEVDNANIRRNVDNVNIAGKIFSPPPRRATVAAALPASAEIGPGCDGHGQEDESEEHHFDLHALDESLARVEVDNANIGRNVGGVNIERKNFPSPARRVTGAVSTPSSDEMRAAQRALAARKTNPNNRI